MKIKLKTVIALLLIPLLIGLILLFASCNPVKKVLRDESKMREVWNKGALEGWCVNDSVYVSDTTIVLDTLHSIDYVSDTITIDNVKYIEKLSYKTIEKKITIRDTTVVTDNSRIELQGKLIEHQKGEIKQLGINLKESEALTKQKRQERNKWRLYFFLAVFSFAAWILRKPIIKLIKPI